MTRGRRGGGGEKRKFKLVRFYRTLVNVKTPSLLQNQVIAKMSSWVFPHFVFNSGFNAGYPVAQSCLNSGSSNP